MDHPLLDLIDARIKAAADDGAFDDLPGAGKPLPPEDDPENALLNRLIKENKAVPEFVRLSRELADLRAELAETGDRTERMKILKDMSMMEARIEIARRAG
ncbi:MAG: DnaJ family domain-containing protein [Pseudomonadota bacterium]